MFVLSNTARARMRTNFDLHYPLGKIEKKNKQALISHKTPQE